MTTYEPSGRCSWRFWPMFAALTAAAWYLAWHYQLIVDSNLAGDLTTIEAKDLRRRGRAALILILLYPGLLFLGSFACARFGHCRSEMAAGGLGLLLGVGVVGLTHYHSYQRFCLHVDTSHVDELEAISQEIAAIRAKAAEATQARADAWAALRSEVRQKSPDLLPRLPDGDPPSVAAIDELVGADGFDDHLLALARLRAATTTRRAAYDGVPELLERHEQYEARRAAGLDYTFGRYFAYKRAPWTWPEQVGLGGVWVGLVWLLEGLLLVACSVGGAVQAERPYCESCGAWCARDVDHFERKDQDAAGLEALRQAETVDQLIDHPPAEKPGNLLVWYRITRCQRCSGAPYLRVAAGSRKTAKNDMDNLKDLHDGYLPLDDAQHERLKDVGRNWAR